MALDFVVGSVVVPEAAPVEDLADLVDQSAEVRTDLEGQLGSLGPVVDHSSQAEVLHTVACLETQDQGQSPQEEVRIHDHTAAAVGSSRRIVVVEDNLEGEMEIGRGLEVDLGVKEVVPVEMSSRGVLLSVRASIRGAEQKMVAKA